MRMKGWGLITDNQFFFMFSCFLNYLENHTDTSFPQRLISQSNLRLMLNIPNYWFHRQKKKKKKQVLSKYKIQFWIVQENSCVWAQHTHSHILVVERTPGWIAFGAEEAMRFTSKFMFHQAEGLCSIAQWLTTDQKQQRCLQLPFLSPLIVPQLFFYSDSGSLPRCYRW